MIINLQDDFVCIVLYVYLTVCHAPSSPEAGECSTCSILWCLTGRRASWVESTQFYTAVVHAFFSSIGILNSFLEQITATRAHRPGKTASFFALLFYASHFRGRVFSVFSFKRVKLGFTASSPFHRTTTHQFCWCWKHWLKTSSCVCQRSLLKKSCGVVSSLKWIFKKFARFRKTAAHLLRQSMWILPSRWRRAQPDSKK